MPARPAPDRFSLPEWAHRTLGLCGPGRPLAPSPAARLAGLSLSPANAEALLHPLPRAAWSSWTDPDAL